MHKAFFVFLFLLVVQTVSAQKIQRAINSLNESKFDKALELFDELIQKDKTDIAAIIGMAKTYKLTSESNAFTPSEINLKTLITQLNNGRSIYNALTTSDKSFINTSYSLFNYDDVGSYTNYLSDYLWIKYVSISDNIDSVEIFKNTYAFNSNQREKANELLSSLYFKKIEQSTSINAFADYLQKFPYSTYKIQVLKTIERLEFNEVSIAKNTDKFESYLDRYPLTEFKDSILNELARLYFAEVTADVSNKSNVLDGIQKLKKIQTSIISKAYIDSCNRYIFLIDKEEALTKGDLESLNHFLNLYKNKKKSEIEDVITLRNTKWRLQIESDTEPNLSEINKYIRATGVSYESVEPIISAANNYITGNLNKAIDEYLTDYIAKISLFSSSDKTRALNELVRSQLNIQFSVSNKTIYDFLRSPIKVSPDQFMEEFLSKTGFDQLVSMNTIYLKKFGDYDEFLELLNLNATGIIIKKNYEFSGSFVEIIQPKTNFPIFNAIKQRYSIVSFTSPQVKRLEPKGYIVSLNGFMTGDQPCCPSYQIEMLFAKSNNIFTPITAITINKTYQNITMTQDLNHYQKIDKSIFTNAN